MKWIKVPKREKVEQKKKTNLEFDAAKCYTLTNVLKINVISAGSAMQNLAASTTLVPSCSDNSPPA